MASYSDDFERADGSLGSNWITVYGGHAIVSGKAKAISDGTESQSAYNATVGNDQFVEVVVGQNADGASNSLAPMLRSLDASNCYYAWTPQGAFEIWKKVAGAYTALNAGNTTTVAAGDVVRFEAEGTALRLYRNGSLVVSASDSSLSSGKVGMFSFTNDVTKASVASWQGGDLAAAVVAYPAHHYVNLMTA